MTSLCSQATDLLLSENQCKVCGEEVGNKEKALNCDICKKWVHIECGKVSLATYASLKKINTACQGIKWLCEVCEKGFGKMRADVLKIIEGQEKLEERQGNLEAKVEQMTVELVSIRNDIADMIKGNGKEDTSTQVKVAEDIGDLKQQVGELKMKYSEAVKGNVQEAASSNNTNLQSSQERSIQVRVGEALEREKRRSNLVIFGIEETSDQQMTTDKVNEISRIVGVDVNKVKYFGRVGRFMTGAKARVVRVVCEDMETRRSILKGANRLKLESGYERIYIAPDLTKEQQTLDKNLRNKLRDIRTIHKDAKISNNEIIISEDGNRKVLYPLQN
jgi:hypothetical protein